MTVAGMVTARPATSSACECADHAASRDCGVVSGVRPSTALEGEPIVLAVTAAHATSMPRSIPVLMRGVRRQLAERAGGSAAVSALVPCLVAGLPDGIRGRGPDRPPLAVVRLPARHEPSVCEWPGGAR